MFDKQFEQHTYRIWNTYTNERGGIFGIAIRLCRAAIC